VPSRLWLGFEPRTVIVVGCLVAAVMVAEVFWLYSPFGSDSPATVPGATATSTVDSTADSTVDSTVDSSVDAGSGAAGVTTFATIGTVTLRASPDPTALALGKIPRGTQVTVECTAVGSPVKGRTKTDSHWDKVTYGNATGFITNTLVATGAAIDDPTVIPAC